MPESQDDELLSQEEKEAFIQKLAGMHPEFSVAEFRVFVNKLDRAMRAFKEGEAKTYSLFLGALKLWGDALGIVRAKEKIQTGESTSDHGLGVQMGEVKKGSEDGPLYPPN